MKYIYTSLTSKLNPNKVNSNKKTKSPSLTTDRYKLEPDLTNN